MSKNGGLIVLGGAALIGIGFLAYTAYEAIVGEKCQCCNKRSKNTKSIPDNLLILNMIANNDKLVPGSKLCLECYNANVSPFEERILSAMVKATSVKYYSKNYLGNTHTIAGDHLCLRSKHFRDKETALAELKTLVAYHGYDKVINLDYEVETHEASNGYIYRTWSAYGQAAHSDKFSPYQSPEMA